MKLNMENKFYRVIVCGTNFGRIYIEGITRKTTKCKLVGILSKGSQQSRKCAESNGVPLYTNVSQISSSEVDIVCVAVKSSITGGKGTEIAKECLKKGINVIQEQPVHFTDAKELYAIAIANKCHYYINNFYSKLPSGMAAIRYANKILHLADPILVEAECSIQVLYPLLDIIGKMLGGITPCKVYKTGEKNGILTILEGSINKIPLILKVENRMVSQDSDNYALLFHRIVVFTKSGQLVMDNSIGAVLWEPRYFIPKKDNILELFGDNEYSKQKVSEVLNEECLQYTYQDIYENIWPEGIANAFDEFITIIKEKCDRQFIQYQLNLCKLWNDIGTCIGPTHDIYPDKFPPICIKGL